MELSKEREAMLAGAAEWLSAEFDLPKPAWVDDTGYFLTEPWGPWQELGLDEPEHRMEVLRCSLEAS